MQESKNNLKEHPDLYQRSIKGGYWVFAIRLLTQLLGFFKTIIVFNILFEKNLELIFVANLFIAALSTFTESGLSAALVQKKEDIKSYLDTAWVIGIFRGIILFIVIYFAAPLFASIKVDPKNAALAVSVIRAMGVCFLIRAFHNIGVVYFQKELQFQKTFWLSMTGALTNIVLSISLLLIYRSVWAVVAAQLISALVDLALSYLLSSYRPRFHFVPEKARELWRFGKWLFGSNILGYFLNEGDDWFVLFFFADPLPFKLYRGAYRLTQMPITHITSAISQVSFPAYAKIQHDLPRLREAYLKVLKTTALISVPMAFLIISLGPDFVRLFIIKESHAMIPIMQILAFKGLLSAISSTRTSLFNSLGKPQIMLYFKGLRLVILVVTIYPLAKIWGVLGVAISVVGFSLITSPLGFCAAIKLLKSTVWQTLRPIVPPMIGACIMTLIISYLKHIGAGSENLTIFFVLITFFVMGYIVILGILDYVFNFGALQIIQEQLNLISLRTKGKE